MPLTVHHLQVSQSERLPWLCEELGIEYTLKQYKRSPLLAPPDFKALHPMGAAPVITDGAVTLAESCACMEYISHKYAGGKLFVSPSDPAYPDFLYWWHWADGTLQPSLGRIMLIKSAKLPDDNPVVKFGKFRSSQALKMLDERVRDNEWLAGKEFSAADIMVVFPLTTIRYFSPYSLEEYPNILKYLERIAKREGFKKTMDKIDPSMEMALGANPPQSPFKLTQKADLGAQVFKWHMLPPMPLESPLLSNLQRTPYLTMSSNSEKPVIALVQGAWHRASHYQDLVQALNDKGFTVLQPDNVTAGKDEDIKGKTHLDDVAAIREALQPVLDEGKQVALVCHSYGGIPGSAAVEGYQVHERESKGLSGGISHVIYIAAFALPVKGLSLLSAAGGTHGPFLDRTDGICYLNEKAMNAFYNDCSPGVAEKAISECVNHSTASLETPADFVATDITVPKTYVVCEIDNTVPVQGQLAMVGAMGDAVTVEKIHAGHCPFLNEEALPKVVDIIAKAAQ
ncbi:glutathione S-transferase [Fusarium beomiforme]|uniref:Glutathione S-transferase n=1 Tax=Fusarium beomiforme TaxID=44412 RepID=A0A9P5AI69_9HYPO|nr:glutathione S-transferase [Fusarium beomiforme]